MLLTNLPSWVSQPVFLYIPGPHVQKWHTKNGQSPPTSIAIKKMQHRLVYMHFLNWSCLFQNDSSSCQVDIECKRTNSFCLWIWWLEWDAFHKSRAFEFLLFGKDLEMWVCWRYVTLGFKMISVSTVSSLPVCTSGYELTDGAPLSCLPPCCLAPCHDGDGFLPLWTVSPK